MSGSAWMRSRKRDIIDETVIEANVDHVGSVDHLLAGDLERVFELAFFDEFTKARRAGDIGPFPDHEEIFIRSVIVNFGAG